MLRFSVLGHFGATAHPTPHITVKRLCAMVVLNSREDWSWINSMVKVELTEDRMIVHTVGNPNLMYVHKRDM